MTRYSSTSYVDAIGLGLDELDRLFRCLSKFIDAEAKVKEEAFRKRWKDGKGKGVTNYNHAGR